MDPGPTGQDRTPRPTSENADIFGITHQGNVRPENQDHFLVGSLHKMMEVHQTSLADGNLGPLISPPRSYVFLVADGLGGGPRGREASDTALRAIADYVTHAMDLYTNLDEELEPAFVADLLKSVERSHQAVRRSGEQDIELSGMATTLTMVTIRWPKAYVVHVGDSRCYRLRDGQLEQMTRDQTMAQAMVDAGAFSPDQAEQSKLKHVLWSALGGKQAVPDTVTTDIRWSDVMLLCTDGLTKHVSDEEIREQLAKPQTAEATCQALVSLALERGGRDNVTVVTGRLKK